LGKYLETNILIKVNGALGVYFGKKGIKRKKELLTKENANIKF
tara:strand:+ start:73 stop:201 length:129 start_codon:yes stop_codon:yes gene_type:complete